MEKIINKAIKGGFDFYGKLENKGLGAGKWRYDPDLYTIDIVRNVVEIDYAAQETSHIPIHRVFMDAAFWQALFEEYDEARNMCREFHIRNFDLGMKEAVEWLAGLTGKE